MKLDLRVWCGHQNFLSHARVAEQYQSILQNICHIVEDPDQADVAILHYEAPLIPRILEDIPSLRSKYLIGYFVWESNVLPAAVQNGVRKVDEVWTASAYCYDIFARYHPKVTWVPHLVEWPNPPADRGKLAQLIDASDTYFNYFTITQENMGRKNSRGLLDAFGYVAKRVPNARLIMKTITYPLRPDAQPEVQARSPSTVIIDGKLDGSLLSALYDLADVYVSPHFSEGWGLPLSDAMLLGKPVVATAYSGNMDFMTRFNSLLVNVTEEGIKPRDHYYAFDSSMRWGYPHRESLEHQMLHAYRMHQDGTSRPMVEQAKQDVANFNRERLTHYIRDLLSRPRPAPSARRR